MTAQSPQPLSRTWSPRPAATRTVPSTLWAAGTEPLDPGERWPMPIVSRAVSEFSYPGEQVLLLTWPAPATRGPLTVLPPGTSSALAAIEALDRTGRITAGNPGPDQAAELVLASLLAPDTDPVLAADQVVDLAAARLAEGGLLVVLSRCGHSSEGVLCDPAGAVVAAAQAADLLYLQHIIAAPLHGDTVSIPAPGAPAPTPARHTVTHTDLFVFLRVEPTPAPQP